MIHDPNFTPNFNPNRHRPPMRRTTIDITPGAGWRRAARGALAALVLLIAVPLLWFFGVLLLLGLVAAGALLVGAVIVQQAWRSRRSQRSRYPPIVRR